MVVLYARGRGWSAVFNVAVCNVEKPTADVCEQVQTWLNSLATTCQCCAQGKDARRPAVSGIAARPVRAARRSR
jgi:hypothetical protein